MLISLDWIRDYADLPPNINPDQLGERLTVTTAEVEGVERVSVGARGLIVARILQVEDIAGHANLRAVVLDCGDGKTADTVSAAPVLRVNDKVIFAPPGAAVSKLGTINESIVASRKSAGMILPGDALGMELAAQDAVFVGPEINPGEPVPPELFDDWVVEIDNKSLTHRPDLWGHYGIAREFAAICRVPLKPYPVVEEAELRRDTLQEFPIDIAAPDACRRYSGIVLSGVPTQPAPLWMQLRLGRIGLRPISGLVDLTNYIMMDLGQPMHAFDADKVSRIEVDRARDGDTFETLDGMSRKLQHDDLMILSGGKPVALAGVMGGLETEVSDETKSLLLESANFEPATVRRTATRLGLRTDASARFEKSLDPAHTVLSIQRFVQLARDMYADMKLESGLSDCYPSPHQPVHVAVNPRHVERTMGAELSSGQAAEILQPLGFCVSDQGNTWQVDVPSFRATNDIAIEADVIEELARYVGYQSIDPAMPAVTMRQFEPNSLRMIIKNTLAHFTSVENFNEVFGYIWYDTAWLKQLDYDPGLCVELANPAAEGLERFRQSLMPGLLASAARNRFHFGSFSLIEVGSVFASPDDAAASREVAESRHCGLLRAARGKKAEESLLLQLKSAIESWSWSLVSHRVSYEPIKASKNRPWEHPQRTAAIMLDDHEIGRVSVVDSAIRRRMDEHLAAWSICWAEIELDALMKITAPVERLAGIPAFPQVEMDFSILVPATDKYADVATKLASFDHDLHKLTRFVDSYEGKSVSEGRRSLTFRVVAGDDQRTLGEEDTESFRAAFESHLKGCGYEIRS
ncbi:MAG: phenylalanine--tRNA ligase subunit beta [Planctomycetota bacterium]|jgi:phenylalanyl-tRNA synthetase beta chain